MTLESDVAASKRRLAQLEQEKQRVQRGVPSDVNVTLVTLEQLFAEGQAFNRVAQVANLAKVAIELTHAVNHLQTTLTQQTTALTERQDIVDAGLNGVTQRLDAVLRQLTTFLDSTVPVVQLEQSVLKKLDQYLDQWL